MTLRSPAVYAGLRRRIQEARRLYRPLRGSDEHSYARLFSPLVRELTFGNISFPAPVGGNNLLNITASPINR
jgi:hypothetical protein